MSSFAQHASNKPPFLATAFDWASLGKGKVIDLGGAQGHISVTLARLFPQLTFVVQDRASVVTGAEISVAEDVRERVTLQAHDFFDEQTVEADVYLIRHVLHDWPDKYCLRILRQLIPKLKDGAKVVINDSLVAEPGTMSLKAEREVRYVMLRIVW